MKGLYNNFIYLYFELNQLNLWIWYYRGGQPPQQQFGGPQGGQGGWGGGGWGGNNYGGPQGGPGYQQPQPQQSGDPNQSKFTVSDCKPAPGPTKFTVWLCFSIEE